MTAGRNRFPIAMLEGILPLDRAKVPVDVVAGITLAALAIPEVMGYATIAGMPVITGLYTIVLPLALYALFGSSRHLVVGADSASAAILAAGLAGMAATASDQYVALAGLVALITAAFLILARLVRLGFLADFLSRTVLIGFLTGVGIQVAMGQVAGMLGVSDGTGGTLEKFWNTIQNIPDTSGTTLLVSLAVIAVILGGKYVTTVIPGALIAVIGAIAVSWAFDLEADGVAVLGPVPGGLPSFGLPDVAWSDVKPLLTTAFSIFVVILAQSAATSRAYAAKYGDRFSEDVDLVGLGFANVGAGLTGTFVVNGSPTKTQMVDSAGGRSQVASLTTVGIVVIVLLFLTKPLQYMPEAVLSSVVFLIGIELVKVADMRRIYRVRRDEFVVAAVTAAVVVVVGVEQGILLAIVLSIIDHLRRSYKPNDTVLVRTRDDKLASRPGRRRWTGGAGARCLPLRREPLLRERQSLRGGGAAPHRRRLRGPLAVRGRRLHRRRRLLGRRDASRAARRARRAPRPPRSYERDGRCAGGARSTGRHRRHRIRRILRDGGGRARRLPAPPRLTRGEITWSST